LKNEDKEKTFDIDEMKSFQEIKDYIAVKSQKDTSYLLKSLINITLTGLIIFGVSLIVCLVTNNQQGLQEVKEISKSFITPFSTLLGLACGYYFSGKKSR
jgi:hypothetical protein